MILDCCSTGKKIQVWVKEEGKTRKKEFDLYPYSYLYLYLPDHEEVVEGLESLYAVEECEFRTIHHDMEGYKIYCSQLRDVAEKIELQTNYRAELYNVDVRLDQRFFAQTSLEYDQTQSDLTTLELEVKGEKSYPLPMNRVEEVKLDGETMRGSEKKVIETLAEGVESVDPDVLLFPHADYWMQHLLKKASDYGLELGLSRDGYRRLSSKSYFSYGRTHYRPSAYLPVGRVLVDTVNSFNYGEGGLEGVLVASRLTKIPPNYVSRFTPGTLISSYEVFEALERGIAVPFRKRDAEDTRRLEEVKQADRGGMMFQPQPGVYEDVYHIDFTSMYPSIIVKHNLSPETLNGDRGRGFLPEVLEPLLNLRIQTKQKKKVDSRYEGIDSILKWMLVTCFGYTGYKNAKFGRIEVHEAITRIGRELLLEAKDVAEDLGFKVLHGIVDCLWVQGNGNDIGELKGKVEEETGLLTDGEHFDWIVFPSMADECGAYTQYYGRTDGGMKLRGVASRRIDTPDYIRRMQEEIFDVLAEAKTIEEVKELREEVNRVYQRYRDGILRRDIGPGSLAVTKRVSKLDYSRRCAEASAVKEYIKEGIPVSPGMDVSFVVTDSRRWSVELPWHATTYDKDYYLKTLDKAWKEVSILFTL